MSVLAIPDLVSKNGIDVCFEEERKRLGDILCHDLEIDIVVSEIFCNFFLCILVSLCVCMYVVTELRFVLNCAQICSLFDFFPHLKSRFLCLICLLMFELIHGGWFRLTVISLYGMDFLLLQ